MYNGSEALLEELFSRSCRSSRPEVFCKKGALKNFGKFTGKHLCQSLFFKILLKKRLRHRCSPANFVKFLRTHFSLERLRWLVLEQQPPQLHRHNFRF